MKVEHPAGVHRQSLPGSGSRCEAVTRPITSGQRARSHGRGRGGKDAACCAGSTCGRDSSRSSRCRSCSLLAVAVPEVLERRGRGRRCRSGRRASPSTVADVAAAVDALQGERTLVRRPARRRRTGRRARARRTSGPSPTTPSTGPTAALDRARPPSTPRSRPSRPRRHATSSAGLGARSRRRSTPPASDVPWNGPVRPDASTRSSRCRRPPASVTADLGRRRRPGRRSRSWRGRRRPPRRRTPQMAAATTWGELRGDQARHPHRPARRRGGLPRGLPRRLAAAARDERRDELLHGRRHRRRAGRRRRASPAPRSAPSRRWLDLSDARQQVLREVEAARAAEARRGRRRRGGDRRRQASTGYLVLAGGGLLLALALALAAARSITRPLRELTDAADHLAAGAAARSSSTRCGNPVDDDEHYLARRHGADRRAVRRRARAPRPGVQRRAVGRRRRGRRAGHACSRRASATCT